jgi:hypothetical protein
MKYQNINPSIDWEITLHPESLLINPSAERMTDRTGSFRLLEALDLLNVSHQDTRKRLPHNAVNDDLYKYSEGISKKHNWG